MIDIDPTNKSFLPESYSRTPFFRAVRKRLKYFFIQRKAWSTHCHKKVNGFRHEYLSKSIKVSSTPYLLSYSKGKTWSLRCFLRCKLRFVFEIELILSLLSFTFWIISPPPLRSIFMQQKGQKSHVRISEKERPYLCSSRPIKTKEKSFSGQE